MENPLFSIIVPIYNVEPYLHRCLDSLITQKYEHIEIILINDGSRDNCAEICDDYASEDARIKVIHQSNKGLSIARNTGLKIATGQYIMFVDSDDYIEIDACEKFAKFVCSGAIDIAIGAAKKIDRSHVNEMTPPAHLFGEILTGQEFLKQRPDRSAVWLNLYRRTFLLNNILFFKAGLIYEDEHWTPRVFLAAQQVIVTDIVFYNYIIRKGSLSKPENFRKNADHLINIVEELDRLYNELNDRELMKILKDHLAGLCLLAYCRGNIYNHGKTHWVKKYVRQHYTIRRWSRLKANLFAFSPRLSVAIHNMIRGISS